MGVYCRGAQLVRKHRKSTSAEEFAQWRPGSLLRTSYHSGSQQQLQWVISLVTQLSLCQFYSTKCPSTTHSLYFLLELMLFAHSELLSHDVYLLASLVAAQVLSNAVSSNFSLCGSNSNFSQKEKLPIKQTLLAQIQNPIQSFVGRVIGSYYPKHGLLSISYEEFM